VLKRARPAFAGSPQACLAEMTSRRISYDQPLCCTLGPKGAIRNKARILP
jgi:hypothetical protein